MTVQNDCPFCEMKISSHKNVRPLFIVKSEFLGYNGCNGGDNLEEVMPPPETIKDTVCEESEISKVEPNEQPQKKRKGIL